tara:strand:- start:1425 stop:1700 length:276 start_codon:yes stop_codon:yes gene_type:complete
MAFSSLNSFLLTTEGRVFSWGALSYCLGRQIHQHEEEGGTPEGAAKNQNVDIGEIDFTVSTSITKIACGRSHVLALDAKGAVWSWGTNDKG